MDSFLIDKFVATMNDVCGGLNEDQCNQVDSIVIAAFNHRAERHAQENLMMKLNLQRALSNGVMTLRKKFKERNDADAGLNWQQIQNKINREEGEDTFDY